MQFDSQSYFVAGALIISRTVDYLHTHIHRVVSVIIRYRAPNMFFNGILYSILCALFKITQNTVNPSERTWINYYSKKIG
jgi:hypothetical protein